MKSEWAREEENETQKNMKSLLENVCDEPFLWRKRAAAASEGTKGWFHQNTKKRHRELHNPHRLLNMQMFILPLFNINIITSMDEENSSRYIRYLPPTTRHESITSSPSSIGPIVVLFIIRPQRSRIIGFSGRTSQVFVRVC